MHTATFTANTKLSTTRNFSTFSAFNWVVECARVSSQRRALSKLSLGALEDIGLTEVDAVREAHKPFWA